MIPELWAPRAATVDLIVGDERHELPPSPDRPGWFVGRSQLAPGTRYGFSLDGGPTLPDPRSLSQPDSVHGLSRVVDAALFTRDLLWPGANVRGQVLYELHVGTFTEAGTFDAAVERLSHLVATGVEAVEIMPVAAFPGERGWGYDGVGLYAVHEPYGGVEGLVRFVDACHERGLSVVLDVVHNHLGPEGNYLSAFGPYFTDRHTTPWGEAVNLDGPDSAPVRQFLLESARHWLVSVGVDALRLDAVHALSDDSDYHFLAELSDASMAWAQEVGRPLVLIAESDLNQPDTVSPVGSSRDAVGMDAQWADDVHHALHAFFSGERQGYYGDFGDASTVAKAFERVFIHDGTHSTFRDQLWGAPVEADSPHYNGHSFVAFLQNHDQVGNRAVGDRFAQHASPDLQAAAAAVYLLGPYTPMIFMGEEWAASTPFPYFSHLGPELGPLVTAGRSAEFAAMGWDVPTPDPQDRDTWRSAVLRWDELWEPEHARMLAWYRTLTALRRAEPDLHNPALGQARAHVVDDVTLLLRRGAFDIALTRSPNAEVEVSPEAAVVAAWTEPEPLGGGRFLLHGPTAVVFRSQRIA